MNEPLWPFLFFIGDEVPVGSCRSNGKIKKMLRLICLSSSSFTVIAIQCYGALAAIPTKPLEKSLLSFTSGNNWFQLAPTGPNCFRIIRVQVFLQQLSPSGISFTFSKVEGHLQRIPENLTIGQRVFLFSIFSFLLPRQRRWWRKIL